MVSAESDVSLRGGRPVTDVDARHSCTRPPKCIEMRGSPAPWSSGARSISHADVLFVGAHPDDEFWNLSTFGQWKEDYGVTTGVVTIMRGEGGGNAVGLDDGAVLGLIREVEERAATALVGIDNIFYLDKPDF
jgi:hypothetical protein